MVTEQDVLRLKKQVEEGKQKYIQAQATLAEVNKNIAAYEEELKNLGVDPNKAEEWLAQEEQAINKMYQEILNKFPSN